VSGRDYQEKTIKLPFILALALSIGIIIIILIFTVDEATINKLSETKFRYEFFIFAIILNFVYWILWGLRLKILCNTMDKRVSINLSESTKIIIANLFLASITPSMAGGEPVRIYLLNKNGMSYGCATAAVLGERLLDAIFILAMVPIAFLIFKNIIELGLISTGLLIGVIFFASLLILFLYSIKKPDKTKRFLILISKKLNRFAKNKKSDIRIISRINQEVDNFSRSIKLFTGENKKELFKASLITVLFWSVGFMIPSMILLGLGLPPFFIESYAAQVLLLVIIMMPTTPGSSGVAEIGIYGLYGVLIGTSTYSLIGVFIIIYRFVSYHMNLIAGAIFQYRIFKSIASFSLHKIRRRVEREKSD
jgi:uncharacterized protein (TIRG00374 family)